MPGKKKSLKNMESAATLLFRRLRQIACLFHPVLPVGARPLNINLQDVVVESMGILADW